MSFRWVIAVIVHVRVHLAGVHVAVRFAEGALRFEILRRDLPLDHQLGVRGHDKIDRLALDHLDGLTGQSAGNGHFIHTIGDLFHRRIGDDGRRTDDQGRFKGNPLRLAFLPVEIDVLAEGGREDADPVGCLDMAAVIPDVLNACLRDPW